MDGEHFQEKIVTLMTDKIGSNDANASVTVLVKPYKISVLQRDTP